MFVLQSNCSHFGIWLTMSDEQPHIRFCVNNPHSLAERNQLISQGFECVGCLGNCSQCFRERFMEISNVFIVGDSYQDILSRANESEFKKNKPRGPA